MGAPPELAPPRSASDMLRMAREFLQRRGVEEWRLEAELLVAHALRLDRLRLFLQLDRPVTGVEVDRARDLLVRRGRREPTAYIVGEREFYGRPFRVESGVLIPRSETELLIDRARAWAAARPPEAALTAADLGTGSGVLALTLALELPAARVYAVDSSAQACAVARANLERLLPAEPAARVEIAEGDGLPLLAERVRARGRGFDLLLANPPYVAREQAATLAPEVRDYEPEVALFAPAGDPDHWVRRILEAAPGLLAPGGLALIELGADQAPRVRALGERLGLELRFERDLAGIERVLELRLP